MKRIFRAAVAVTAGAAALSACASSPKKIKAAYVSPAKYHAMSCDEIALERTGLIHRVNVLHRKLKNRSEADAAKMGFGTVLFLPALLFLKGNGVEAAEFAHLKGDYTALQINSEDRNCQIAFENIDKLAASKTLTAGREVEIRN